MMGSVYSAPSSSPPMSMTPAMPLVPPPFPGICPTGLPFTDVDILLFALNLECLEAEFYSWACNGYGLSNELLGNYYLLMSFY